jgi:glycosyltransferase involved in cell wall biosynthesis
VTDLAPIYAGTRVSIAPLQTGAGFKGKVAEALSFGVPCVGTPIAFEGMGLDIGRSVLQSSTVEEFADDVIELLINDSKWCEVSTAAVQHVETQWDPSRARETLEEVLHGTLRSTSGIAR